MLSSVSKQHAPLLCQIRRLPRALQRHGALAVAPTQGEGQLVVFLRKPAGRTDRWNCYEQKRRAPTWPAYDTPPQTCKQDRRLQSFIKNP